VAFRKKGCVVSSIIANVIVKSSAWFFDDALVSSMYKIARHEQHISWLEPQANTWKFCLEFLSVWGCTDVPALDNEMAAGP
jgi:hypothetical protein